MTATRDRILARAGDLMNGDRMAEYGPPSESLDRIAALWAPVLGHDVTPAQVALCMAQLKVARLIVNPSHQDSWVDAAAYVALGGEVAEAPIPPANPCQDCKRRTSTHEDRYGHQLCGPCWTNTEAVDA